MPNTRWSRRSEEVKPNNEELREVKKRDQSPSLGDPGNIHRKQSGCGICSRAFTFGSVRSERREGESGGKEGERQSEDN